MKTLRPCASCDGLIPPRALTCPHCQASVPVYARAVRALTMLLTGSTLAVTLMACYGLPPCDPEEDRDGDGAYPYHCSGPGVEDCNEDDPSIHQCAEDMKGDGIDQNCDGADGTNTSSTSTSSISNGYNPCSMFRPNT